MKTDLKKMLEISTEHKYFYDEGYRQGYHDACDLIFTSIVKKIRDMEDIVDKPDVK